MASLDRNGGDSELHTDTELCTTSRLVDSRDQSNKQQYKHYPIIYLLDCVKNYS
jgi:hypothetical protein